VALIQELKVRAAERNMSLNASIRQALEQTLRFDRDYIAAGERILAASEKGLCKTPRRGRTRVEPCRYTGERQVDVF